MKVSICDPFWVRISALVAEYWERDQRIFGFGLLMGFVDHNKNIEYRQPYSFTRWGACNPSTASRNTKNLNYKVFTPQFFYLHWGGGDYSRQKWLYIIIMFYIFHGFVLFVCILNLTTFLIVSVYVLLSAAWH